MKNKLTKKTTPKGTEKGSAKSLAKNCLTRDPAYNVACYYGAIVTPKVEFDKNHLNFLKSMRRYEGDDKFAPAEDPLAMIIASEHPDIQNLPQPVLLWHEGTYNSVKGFRSHKRQIRLDIVGTHKSIAEAILLQTSISILKEEGLTDLIVDINSIGNKDALGRFEREVTNFYRKNSEEVSANCKQMIKKDILSAHSCAMEEEDEIAFKAPQSLSYLSEDHRNHFQEVLEFMETLHIDYRINNGLLGHRGYATETVFTISTPDSKGGETIVAAGSRYDSLAKKSGFKRDIPAAGITLYLPPIGKTAKAPKPMKKSSFFFIQIGFEAKLRSLQVIEILRKAKIPLYQSISRDKLSAQLTIAEHEKFPYVILMGQKEAIENNVLVRDMNTRFQETVSIDELPAYLRKME